MGDGRPTVGRMQLRIFTEPQQGASYDDLLRVARATEDLGFDAFFRSDHYLSMGKGSGQPGPTDAWLTLAALARDTSRVRLGTLVSPVTFRLPGPLAIAVAQVDQMSGGRVELGLGAGWYEDEHTAYGIPFFTTAGRFDRFVEQVEIVHGLLTTPDEARFSYDGTYYTLADSPALPKPVQSPRPPLILGGAARRRGAALAARYADEFNAGFQSVTATNEIFDRVRAATETTGRSLVYSSAQVLCVGRDEGEVARRAAAIGRDVSELRDNGLAGTPAQVIEKISRFGEIGASRMYLQVLDLGDLDHLELVAAEVLPHV
jgi:F420-dependent oxidoreductase-like protein